MGKTAHKQDNKNRLTMTLNMEKVFKNARSLTSEVMCSGTAFHSFAELTWNDALCWFVRAKGTSTYASSTLSRLDLVILPLYCDCFSLQYLSNVFTLGRQDCFSLQYLSNVFTLGRQDCFSLQYLSNVFTLGRQDCFSLQYLSNVFTLGRQDCFSLQYLSNVFTLGRQDCFSLQYLSNVFTLIYFFGGGSGWKAGVFQKASSSSCALLIPTLLTVSPLSSKRSLHSKHVPLSLFITLCCSLAPPTVR